MPRKDKKEIKYQSYSNLHVERQVLLSFLNDTSGTNVKENEDNNKAKSPRAEKSVFSMMSKEMKKEYFEWVYQKEQAKMEKQKQLLDKNK
eukprot:UN03847